MQFEFSNQFFDDLRQLKDEQAKLAYKVFELLEDINSQPFTGKGKPEPLKGNLAGCWSRRITEKHRIIYKVSNDTIKLVSCFGHYSDK